MEFTATIYVANILIFESTWSEYLCAAGCLRAFTFRR